MKLSNIIFFGYKVQNLNDFIQNGYKLRNDLAHIKLEFPINYKYFYKNFYKDRNLRWSLHCWYHLLPYIYNYDKTKSDIILNKIINEIKNWYSYSHNLYKHKHRELIWDDMAVGIRSQILAYLKKCNVLCLNDICNEHISYLICKNNWRLHNHCLFMGFGLFYLSNTPDKENLAYLKINELINHQFKEGIHCENSPEYHIKIFEIINTFFINNNDVLIKKFPYVNVLLKNIYYNIFWLLRCDNTIVPLGDSENMIYNNNFNIINFIDYNNINIIPIACLGNKYKNFIYKHFSETGYLSIKHITKKFNFLMICNSISKNHKHADNLTFDLYYNQPILINPGKYAYASNNKRKYVLSTRSHNCIEINNMNYQIGNPSLHNYKPYNTFKSIETSENGLVICLSYVNEFNIHHERVINIINEMNYVIKDTLIDNINFKQHFHIGQNFKIHNSITENSVIFYDDNKNSLLVNSDDKIKVFYGLIENDEYITGWYSPSYGIFKKNYGLIINSSKNYITTTFTYTETTKK